MGVRVYAGGRLTYARGESFKPGIAPTLDENGEQVFFHAIERDVPVLRGGEDFDDPEDRLHYRVVGIELRAQDGWHSVEHWCAHLQLPWRDLRAMVLAGLFDAAMRKGSPARLLRALDPPRVEETARLMRVEAAKRTPRGRRLASR